MGPLRYVILRHDDVAEPHFDLMFETLPGSLLSTWRSDVWPIESRVGVTRLRDHRRLYLTFEGDLSGRRGSVQRVAEGTCDVEVGAESIWTIRLLSGAPPQTLRLRPLSAERWQAEPV